MQKKAVTTTSQLQQQSSVSSLPQQVIQFFDSRIQTEQNYAKALQRLNNKFPNIETNPTQSSKVLKHLKAIHSQKYHQTTQFITELKAERNNFQQAISKSNEELQKSANQLKVQEGNLKNIMDKIWKIMLKGEEQFKSIDEKFLLRELSLISLHYKTKKIEDSLKILDQEAKISATLKQEFEGLKGDAEKAIKKIKKYEKTIFETSPLIERQIIELVKKYTVQQVSLIRNLQYDIDTMIKKTNIFDDAPPPLDQNAKPPKNQNIKAAKDIIKNEFKVKDSFEETKKYIANLNGASLKTIDTLNKEGEGKNKEEFKKLIDQWNEKKSVQSILNKLNEDYANYKIIGHEFVQYFRNKNINKFSEPQFNQLKKLFALLFAKTIEEKDLFGLQKLIVYASCYCCQIANNEKGPAFTLMDTINKKQFLSDPFNWKYLLFFVILRCVSECQTIQNEKDMHLKNNVFSALVSSSLNMIGCGIDKYTIKNTIAKMAKSFGLAENQTGDLLKFIEAGFEKYEKQRGKK